MSYEMKDILKTMIDNNEVHWSADTMDMARVELDHVYSQAAKADEYEAKAKAYDAIAINIKALRKHMLNSGKSVNAKIIETENTIKHIEAIIERTDTDV